MIELAQNAESHELIEAFEKLRQEAARLQTRHRHGSVFLVDELT
jgi:cell fate (sporulation/competence/biofilm development) regulator YlbF (YheA/YmcA/DUF963 family)